MFLSKQVELYTAHSLAEQGALRQLLEKADIDHSVTARDTHAPKGFYPVLSPALLMTQTVEFIFYVKQADFDKADALLKQEWHWAEQEAWDED